MPMMDRIGASQGFGPFGADGTAASPILQLSRTPTRFPMAVGTILIPLYDGIL
jgi:hypothetical protein